MPKRSRTPPKLYLPFNPLSFYDRETFLDTMKRVLQTASRAEIKYVRMPWTTDPFFEYLRPEEAFPKELLDSFQAQYDAFDRYFRETPQHERTPELLRTRQIAKEIQSMDRRRDLKANFPMYTRKMVEFVSEIDRFPRTIRPKDI